MPANIENFISKYFVAPFFLVAFFTLATSDSVDEETFIDTAVLVGSFAVSFFGTVIACAISYIRFLERHAPYPLRHEHFDD